MIRFARSFITAGIALFLSLTMDVHARTSAAATVCTQVPSCSDTSELDPETAMFVNMQCSIRSQLFPTSSDATLLYQLDDEIQKPGDYQVLGVEGYVAKLNVVWALPVNDIEIPPAFAGPYSGVRACSIVGRLHNSSGVSLPIAGVAFTFKNATLGTRQHYFMVTNQLTNGELDAYSIDSRLSAGIRLVDSVTGVSYGWNSTLPGPILNASASASDPSTIYCLFGSLPPGAGGIDLNCIKTASETYQNSKRTCEQFLALAVAAAFVAYFAMIAYCAIAAGSTGPLGVGIGIACLLNALRILAGALALAAAAYAICANSAMNQLKIDLRGCGVNLVEM